MNLAMPPPSGGNIHINPNLLHMPPPGMNMFQMPPPAAHHYHQVSMTPTISRSAGSSDMGSNSAMSASSVSGGGGSSSAKGLMPNMPPGMDARRMRKAVYRRTIDYNAPVINNVKNRIAEYDFRDRWAIQPDYLYQAMMEPSYAYSDNPLNCITTKHVRTSTNKNKCPIYCVCWTPEGRRLITGAYSGEFTLWNGLTFNFETILQAHETQIRCMKWSHNEDWLLTADHSGFLKYWQANMNNVVAFQSHKEPVRGVSFCPSDDKFVTCSDDSTVRIWDFYQCTEERVLRGHGADVRCVAWHPDMALIISGSKDAQQPIKLWDPRTGRSLKTLYVHKNTCTDVAWNKNGNWFLTASRDHLIKLFDVRYTKSELHTFRGHKKDVMRVAWHPQHESLFASGSADGAIMYWLVGTDMEVGAVEDAHENMIWSLAWHPMGHILVSGANDFATKFWTRNRPGDVLKESATSGATNTALAARSSTTGLQEETEEQDTADVELEARVEGAPGAGIPGLNEGQVEDQNLTQDEADEREKARARAVKSIPRQFAVNWSSARLAAMPALLPNNARPVQGQQMGMPMGMGGPMPPPHPEGTNPSGQGMPPGNFQPSHMPERPPGPPQNQPHPMQNMNEQNHFNYGAGPPQHAPQQRPFPPRGPGPRMPPQHADPRFRGPPPNDMHQQQHRPRYPPGEAVRPRGPPPPERFPGPGPRFRGPPQRPPMPGQQRPPMPGQQRPPMPGQQRPHMPPQRPRMRPPQPQQPPTQEYQEKEAYAENYEGGYEEEQQNNPEGDNHYQQSYRPPFAGDTSGPPPGQRMPRPPMRGAPRGGYPRGPGPRPPPPQGGRFPPPPRGSFPPNSRGGPPPKRARGAPRGGGWPGW